MLTCQVTQDSAAAADDHDDHLKVLAAELTSIHHARKQIVVSIYRASQTVSESIRPTCTSNIGDMVSHVASIWNVKNRAEIWKLP